MAGVAGAAFHHALQDRVVVGGSVVALASLVYVLYGRRSGEGASAVLGERFDAEDCACLFSSAPY